MIYVMKINDMTAVDFNFGKVLRSVNAFQKKYRILIGHLMFLKTCQVLLQQARKCLFEH